MHKKWISVLLCMLLISVNLFCVNAADADCTRLNLPETWKYATGKGVNVAVLDSGADLNDSAIKSNIKGVYDAVNQSTSWNAVNTKSSHGTNCAKNIVKVAPDVNLYIIKVGEGNTLKDDATIRGLQWAHAKGCRVISMSFGGDGYDEKEHQVIDSVYRASKNSSLVFASGGNGGARKYHYPASYDNTIAVGAAKYNSSKKSYVIIPKATYNDRMDLTAPGGSTSASTPFAAGVAALVFQVKPSYTAKQCGDVLKATALDLGAKGKDEYYGYGLVQPYKAIQKAGVKIPKSVKSITLSSKKTTMNVGNQKKLTYKFSPSGSTAKVTWSTSNKKIATVSSSGVVTAKQAGSATITVKVKSSIKATCKVTVKPAAVKNAYLKNVDKNGKSMKKKLLVTWKRDTKCTGYQIQISTSKNFKSGVKKATIKKNSTTSKTFTKLKSNSKYYMRIRAYKKINKKTTYYGPWSQTSSPLTVR